MSNLRRIRSQNPYLEPVSHSSYFAARQERQDRQLLILSAGKLWRTIAILALLANTALAAGLVGMSQMRKETPFVIAVDKWGYTVPIGEGVPVNQETYVQYHLKDFIRASRSILLAHEISLIFTISASSISLGRKAKPTTTYTHRIKLAADQAASTLTTIHVLAGHLTFGNSHSRWVYLN